MRAPQCGFSVGQSARGTVPSQASRREFMRSGLLAGAGAVLSSAPPSLARPFLSRTTAQSTPAVRGAKAGRIDVHYHLTPPALIQTFGAKPFANAANSANSVARHRGKTEWAGWSCLPRSAMFVPG